MITLWTILHGILAMALVGALTHQGLAVWRTPTLEQSFFARYRAVRATGFANAIVVLYVLTFIVGAYIYPTYVLDVKASLLDYGMPKTIGLFQLKEHLTVVGLALLPVYWHFWRSIPLDVDTSTRRFLTTFLMLAVWWNLVIGHLLNNIKGLT